MGPFERMRNGLHGMKAGIIMVGVQIVLAGVNVFFKLAINDGMSPRIIVAYRFLFASAFIGPIAFFVERNTRPKISWWVLFYAFLCGLLGGTLTQNLYIQSLALTSATFVSAIQNLAPAVTFILAVCFRMEKLNMRAVGGVAKVVGTLIGIAGAMLLTFYKGFQINIWSTHFDLLHHDGHVAASPKNGHNQLLGSLLAVGSCVCSSLWFISEAKLMKIYPCHYSSTALMCFMAAIQTAVVSLCMERDRREWKLGWNIRLWTVAYAGIISSGVAITLISWCVHMKGPLYVSAFSPLMLVLVAVVASLCLNEHLYLGSVMGAVLIIGGLYIVLWGKSKEAKKDARLAPVPSVEEPELTDVVVTVTNQENGTKSPTPNQNNKN